MAGYPTRKTYSEFVDRFGILAPEFMDGRWVCEFFADLNHGSLLYIYFYEDAPASFISFNVFFDSALLLVCIMKVCT